MPPWLPHGGLRAKGARIASLKVALVKCGRCGKRYNNPLTHKCVTQMGRRQGSTKVKPKVTVKCGRCHRPLGNPLTHRCVTRTDFTKRKAAAAKPAKPQARPGTSHEYTDCDDDDCQRFPCRVYKEGRADGFATGWDRGYARGYADGYERGYKEGYGKGFPDGIAACPRPHK